MIGHNPLLLIALLLPLSLDSFVLSAALGMAGMPKKDHLRTSVILSLFEGGMPLVGLLIGRGLGKTLGSYGGYAAAIVIGIAGLLMLVPESQKNEEKEVKLLARAKGWSVIGLGLSISIDELAIGFSLGLLRVPLVLVVLYIALQTYVLSRLGLWLGGRLSERFMIGAERLGGLMLLGVGLLLLFLKLSGHSL